MANPMATDQALMTPPPCALRRNKKLVHHGHERVDPYYWLRDDKRRDAQVLAHLRAENAYTQAMLAHTEPLQQQLYEELVGRVAQDDDTVPYEKHGDWHYRRFRKGEEHPVYARRRGSLEAPEEIVLDVNRLAEGHAFYEVGNLTISPDGRWLAYVEDPVSRGEWTLRIKNLESGETHDPGVTNVSTCLAWANDSRTLFFIRQQEDTLIPYQVWRMHRDRSAAEAVLVLEEDDPRFSLALSRSRDDLQILLTARQTLSTETHLVSASEPAVPPSLVLAREADHEYWVEPLDDTLWIRSNWQAPNYRLFRTSLSHAADRSKWQ
jgi:oligopeptidase B